MIDQGTSSWHEWRHQGLGSSDCPTIMGVSPYRTRFQLWQEKTGLVPRSQEPNWAQQRGHDLEPKARAAYEIEQGFADFPPKLAEHPTFPFLRASLDGWNQELQRVLEIKVPGRADHELALGGTLPAKYWPQVQFQLLVTGAKDAHYFSYWGETPETMKGATVLVLPDQTYQLKLLTEMLLFWQLVLTGRPPEFQKEDFKYVNKKETNGLAKQYLNVRHQLSLLESQILAHPETQHERFRIGNLRVSRATPSCPLDYDRLPQLAEVDFAKFPGSDVRRPVWEVADDGA